MLKNARGRKPAAAAWRARPDECADRRRIQQRTYEIGLGLILQGDEGQVVLWDNHPPFVLGDHSRAHSCGDPRPDNLVRGECVGTDVIESVERILPWVEELHESAATT
jgi:hypothetical protein